MTRTSACQNNGMGHVCHVGHVNSTGLNARQVEESGRAGRAQEQFRGAVLRCERDQHLMLELGRSGLKFGVSEGQQLSCPQGNCRKGLVRSD